MLFSLIGGLGGRAIAGPKPTVAILGLEVVDPSGNIDQPSTMVARDLTDGLRSRAKVGSGPYTLQPGSDKELIDEKLIKNCDNEAIGCMAQIGKDLGADYLIFGRLEKKSDGYVVTINLLNVAKKKFEKAKTPLLIPFNQKDSQALQAAARKAYNDLAGISEAGTLVIRANADKGTVLLDDNPRGNLASGSATIGQIPEGRYRLAIEAEGFKRSDEITITIRSGETTNQPVTLVAADGGKDTVTGSTSSGGRSGIWKGAFVVSVVAGIASGGVWAYGFTQIASDSELKAVGDANPTLRGNFSQADCGNKAKLDMDTTGVLNDSCSGYKMTKWGAVGVSISGAAILFTGYMAFIRGGGESRPVSGMTAGRTKKKRALSITPIVSADGAGATFQLDW